YAIGCFNTSDLEITKAIISAAQKQNSPVMIATTPKAIEYAGLEALAGLIKQMAKSSKVPIVLHLDHGKSIEIIQQCLELGYQSVMIDGSEKPLEENIRLTAEAVEIAHQHKAICEGELGHLGKAGTNQDRLTNQEDIENFVSKTHVDLLAVSIGSKHGIELDEKLNIALLKKIHAETNIPLVLHGASGVSDNDINQAIANGICKINIDTDIRHTFSKSIRQILAKYPQEEDFRNILSQVMADIQKLVEEKIKLFGSTGKG
ncbi:MAG: class II fructose-bisphosphate aldolase, partial [Patescibacteria group bacterium]